MLQQLVRDRILGSFYRIPLNTSERTLANDAVDNKYAPALSQSIVYSCLLVPSLLVLNTDIVVSVLIPATMVAGTAWFAVSLASMKQKFGNFGMELTTHLFVAFTLSLLMLFLATATSLTAIVWQPLLPPIASSSASRIGAALLALLVVGKLLGSIFLGSLKYDINDAMLTGQNEAAERFFKQSLSLLFTTSQALRLGMSLQVANYYLGLCFYEVAENIRELQTSPESANRIREQANRLLATPGMTQVEADALVLQLVGSFVELCTQDADVVGHRSYEAVAFELGCLLRNQALSQEIAASGIDISDKENKETRAACMARGLELQDMVDIRMSIVLAEIARLIEEFGPRLFRADSATATVASDA